MRSIRILNKIGWIILLGMSLASCRVNGGEDPMEIVNPNIGNENVIDLQGIIRVIQDSLNGQDIVVVGSQEINFVSSFLNPSKESFVALQDEYPAVMQGADGTKYDFFGVGLEGPQQGSRLSHTNGLMGFWMTFGAFYPGLEIYGGDPPDPAAKIEVSTNSEWLIPSTRVFDGGPGKDGIPSLENLVFRLADRVDFMAPEDLVIGFRVGDDIRAYPHKILDWHEIVNDDVDDQVFTSITYCPLTGTASAWNREIGGKVTTFGVSGLLYNTNLMPYDRETDSYWSQMRFDCVNGSSIGQEIEVQMIVETSWNTWLNLYPNSIVLTPETGFNRNYQQYPYGDYRTNDNNIIFPLEYDDQRLPRKERVHAVILDGVAKAYPLPIFN
ncbi:MAG: DUF3179 domain-containing protein [Bacteroidota bacterium]